MQSTRALHLPIESSALADLLAASAARHAHLCPRQVLGVRVGLAGAAALDVDVPQTAKRLLVILEMDGCFADGVEVATGCSVGHRTLRVEDYGKVAATFVNTRTGQAVRVSPRLDVRQRASFYLPDEDNRYFAQLRAYQIMPDEELLSIQPVRLVSQVEDLVSRAGVRVNCMVCGEEIINQREIVRFGLTLCLPCAGTSYYQVDVGEWATREPGLFEGVYQVASRS